MVIFVGGGIILLVESRNLTGRHDAARTLLMLQVKYIRTDETFAYTFCSGTLLTRLRMNRNDFLCRSVIEPFDGEAEKLLQYFDKAWNGEDNVAFDANIQHIPCSVLLNPVVDHGVVTEVIGTYTESVNNTNHDSDVKIRENAIQLLEDSFLGVFIFQDDQLLYFNQYLCDLFGYTRSEFSQINPFSLIQQDEEEVRRSIQSTEEQTGGISFRVIGVAKGGRRIHLEAFRTHLIINNKPAIMGMMMDVTEHVKTKRQLQESEQRYRNQLMYSPVPIVVHSENIIVYANEALVKLAGAANRYEILGRSILDYMLPEDHKFVRNRLKRIIDGELLPFVEQKLCRKDGTIVEVESRSTVISQYRDEPLIQTVIKDVTEHKRIEKSLVAAEEKYRILVEKALMGVYVYQKNRITYVNPQFIEIFGYSHEEIMRMDPLSFVAEDYRHSRILFIEQCLAGKTVSQPNVYRGVTRDGKLIDLEESISIFYDDGVPTLIGMLSDITDRKQTEVLINKSEKLAALGQLAAGIAHEIRNPLTTLKGFIQLFGSNETVNQKYVGIMLSEINRINSIVSEFMFLAKPQTEDFQVRDITVIVEEVINFIQAEALLHNVLIDLAIDEAEYGVYCNTSQLKQVFINIIKNGIEAMPSGGLLKVVLTTVPDTGRMMVRIIDQGVGMPQERIELLGEPFYTTKEKGNGLGLMMCSKIIETHKGTIDFQSKINQGTIVSITLPLEAP